MQEHQPLLMLVGSIKGDQDPQSIVLDLVSFGEQDRMGGDPRNPPPVPAKDPSTLALWDVADGKRCVIGCARRSTDEAPPRQRGLAGRARQGGGAAWLFTRRFSGMATASFEGLGPALR